MPAKFTLGETITSAFDTYVVGNTLSEGAFAHAAKAQSKKSGYVFLKRYFKPAKSVEWFNAFVSHQVELKTRIGSDADLKQYCYKFIDFFVGSKGPATNTFHQAFEFIDGGKPLTNLLTENTASLEETSWMQRFQFCQIMMAGVSSLHSKKIVHTDLKPDNIYLVPNKRDPSKYYLKIIDLDWAIFSDQKAPWDGIKGYVGTPGYWSPEHLRGEVPGEKSDTFTCAIMLSELLAGEHPFKSKFDDMDLLKKSILDGDFKRFELSRPIKGMDDPRHLEDLINQAMSPLADDRPTSTELKNVLLGIKGPREELEGLVKEGISSKPSSTSSTSVITSDTTSTGGRLELMYNGEVAIGTNIGRSIGKRLFNQKYDEVKFYSEKQFLVSREASGGWLISPQDSTTNETLIDGHKLVGPTQLKAGMRIAVGNSSRGVEKFPLVVKIL